MEETLSITITSEIKETLDNITQTEGIPLDNLVREALEDYLFIRKFRALRSHMLQKTQNTYTDEEIFEQVS